VQFDGVYHDSKIYLNGTEVGSQRFGYVSFCCDLTPYLNATGDNVLAVFVDNVTSRRSHFYSGTGIYRHVWLIATDPVHIRNWGTAVTTPTVAVAQSQIRVQTDVVNELATAQTRTMETTIYDEDHNALAIRLNARDDQGAKHRNLPADADARRMQTLVARDPGALLCLFPDSQPDDADR
jgi:beta-galactosidase